mgnify:CR=1 FL=1
MMSEFRDFELQQLGPSVADPRVLDRAVVGVVGHEFYGCLDFRVVGVGGREVYGCLVFRGGGGRMNDK